MTSVQWVYANGSNWFQLDPKAQVQIENLWSTNATTGIVYSQTFLANVNVSFSEMALVFDGFEYTIARLTS